MKSDGRIPFTLVELICVMVLLAMLFALSLPALSSFLHGRQIVEEGRRVLALTHYARNRAISASMPVELWIDSGAGELGVNILREYDADDTHALHHFLVPGVTVDAEMSGTDSSDIIKIVYGADGTLTEPAPARVRICDGRSTPIELVKVETRQRYVIAPSPGIH